MSDAPSVSANPRPPKRWDASGTIHRVFAGSSPPFRTTRSDFGSSSPGSSSSYSAAASTRWRPWVWSLPLTVRKFVGRHKRRVDTTVAAVSGPWQGVALVVVSLSIWHARVLYEAALGSDTVHGIEHASFLMAGLGLWAVVLRRSPGPGPILALFLVALHVVFLSALMTFAGSPWYPAYGLSSEPWGLSAMEDQRLAGVVMWTAGSLVYAVSTVTIVVRWLSKSEADSAASPP